MLIPLGTDRPLRRPTQVTYALIIATVTAHVCLSVLQSTDPTRAEAVWNWGTLVRPATDSGFHWWTLITYAFLHAPGWQHIAGNMLILYVFGPNIEDRLGRTWFLLFYLLGAAAAGGLHILFSQHPVIGASGAIAACTGAYLVLFPRTRIKVLFLLTMGIFQVSAWWFIAISVAWEWLMPAMHWGGGNQDNVAHLAHLGGYLYGIAIALILLWLKIVPREVFDLFTMGRQAYRRRAFKEAGLAADQRNKERWAKAKAGETAAETDAIAAARADVVTRLTQGDVPGGARAYKELADRYAHVPLAATLSRRWQYDLANWYYQSKDHDAAAYAYARFLEAYPTDPEAGHIRLLLGMIHARSLNDPVKAKSLIAESLKTLQGGELEMAKREMEALG